MPFYTQVLLELVAAVGAALAFGNALALMRRRRDGATAREKARTTPRAPRQHAPKGEAPTPELVQAPVFRSIVFLVIGLVACVWSLATLVAS